MRNSEKRQGDARRPHCVSNSEAHRETASCTRHASSAHRASHSGQTDNLDTCIRDAYTRMEPSPEAERRMLSALFEAQERKRASNAIDSMRSQQVAPGDSKGGHAKQGGTPSSSAAAIAAPRRNSKPTRERWRRAAIAAAACCALACIGLFALIASQGMLANQNLSSAAAGSEDASLSVSIPNTDTETDAASDGDSGDGSAKESGSAIAGSSTENSSSGAPDNGSSTETADSDIRYPYVTLSTGETLEVVRENGTPAIARAQDLGETVGSATASNDAGEQTPCFVLKSAEGSPYPYVVSFTKTGELFFAQAVSGNPTVQDAEE